MARTARKNNVLNMPGTDGTEGFESSGKSSRARANPEEVARRAYEIYQARGGYHGADLDDWLQAERELLEAPAPARPRRRASGVVAKPLDQRNNRFL